MRLLALLVLVVVAACAPLPVPGNPKPCASVGGKCVDERPEVIAWQVPVELSHHTPAAGASIAPAFQFNCTSSAQRIEATSGQNYTEIVVWNAACSGGTCTPSSTPVFLGGSTSMTENTGMPICSTTGCIAGSADLNVRGAFCITHSATVTVTAQVLQ